MRILIYLLFLSTSLFAQQSKAEIATVSDENGPLILLDGKPQKYSSLKVFFEGLDGDIIESMSALDPLYIINGVEYTEQELFGPKPRSPYYPLNKQEIISTTVYQEQDAIKLYGQMKGQGGVVVIETNDGKPLKK